MARGHPGDHIVGEIYHLAAHVDAGSSILASFVHGSNERDHLFTPDGEELVDRPSSKELRHAEFLQEPPVGTVGRKDEVGAAVGDVTGGPKLRAVRPSRLLRSHNLFGGRSGGGHNAGDGAEAEADQVTVALRELMEGLVGDRPEVMEVANYRQGDWTRREAESWPPAPACEE